MASIFTKIVNGDIPCYKVAEDDRYFAFLDINPVQKGHVLVIPKQEVDYIFDLDPETLGGLHQFAQRVAIALRKAIPCKKVAVVVLGLEVPHAHIHLIPMNAESDIRFGGNKLQLSSDEFNTIAESISKNL